MTISSAKSGPIMDKSIDPVHKITDRLNDKAKLAFETVEFLWEEQNNCTCNDEHAFLTKRINYEKSKGSEYVKLANAILDEYEEVLRIEMEQLRRLTVSH